MTKNDDDRRGLGRPLVKITELDHIGLRVKDVENSLRFYSGLLGLKTERAEEWREGKTSFPSVRINADTLIDFFSTETQLGSVDGKVNQDHFCLVVEFIDMERLKNRLEDMGVRIHAGPGKRWGAHGDDISLYVYDPDQNVVELRCY